MKKRWIIDWRIEGHTIIEAESAAQAQAEFDRNWGRPRGIDPVRDGEVSNDTPVPAGSDG